MAIIFDQNTHEFCWWRFSFTEDWIDGDSSIATVFSETYMNPQVIGLLVRLVDDILIQSTYVNIGWLGTLENFQQNSIYEFRRFNTFSNIITYDYPGVQLIGEFCYEDIDEDGVPDNEEVLGCTDEGNDTIFASACNYNSLATEDDGSCEYGTCEGICGYSFEYDNSNCCWCDDQCEDYGDCCPDYEEYCTG